MADLKLKTYMPSPFRIIQILIGVIIVIFVWQISRAAVIENTRLSGRHRLQLYVQTLQWTIEKYEYLPFVLSLNKELQEFLNDYKPGLEAEKLNQYLMRVRTASRSAEIFVLNKKGTAILASNYDTPESYMNNDYFYRPYYTSAAQGKPGRFYGVGTTTGMPGYFLSMPVRYNGIFVGVVVVKVSFSDLEEAWRRSGDNVIVSDANGVIFLSSIKKLKFHSWNPLNVKAEESIRQTKQYDGYTLTPLDINYRKTSLGVEYLSVKEDGAKKLHNVLSEDQAVDRQGWTMHLLHTEQDNSFVALTSFAALLSYLAILAILEIISLQRRRLREHQEAKTRLQRAHDQLEQKVLIRTADLREINEHLMREIEEKTRMGSTLAMTRNKLDEANQLAALGQLATGIAHELNQPLAALRTFAENTQQFIQRGEYKDALGNLDHITLLIERMAHQTSELRAFSSRHRGALGEASLPKAVTNALALFDSSLREKNIKVVTKLPEEEILVSGDPIGLEQIFGNLIANAIDALSQNHIKDPTIHIVFHEKQEQSIQVDFFDNGRGIDKLHFSKIFDAFFSTKKRGLGLGLAIVKTIMTESNGTVFVDNGPEGGAQFTLIWKVKS